MRKSITSLVALALLLGLAACGGDSVPASVSTTAILATAPITTAPPTTAPPTTVPPEPGEIYLYGEAHGVELLIHREFELWHDHYHNDGMRHLFIEFDYYIAEFINMWMQADNDDILEMIFEESAQTASSNPFNWVFFQRVKAECPETVFHGTDVGHFHFSIGPKYLDYLIENGLMLSEPYKLAIKCIEQGKEYGKQYGKQDNQTETYRENAMVENFIHAFDALEGESIMGIYGAAHTGLDSLDFTGEVDCMATQLVSIYGDRVHSLDLRTLEEPLRVDTITVAGKEYQASYFGVSMIGSYMPELVSLTVWRLEDAYEDFKGNPATNMGESLDAFFRPLEEGQVFVIDHTDAEGHVERRYARSDGDTINGEPLVMYFTLS